MLGWPMCPPAPAAAAPRFHHCCRLLIDACSLALFVPHTQQAAFVLASICDHHPRGQLLCAQAGLLQVCAGQLSAALAALAGAEQQGSGRRCAGLVVQAVAAATACRAGLPRAIPLLGAHCP